MSTNASAVPESVCGFAFYGPQVALIRKVRPPWQAGRLNGVGGKVEHDADKSPVHAMAREFLEETGIRTWISDWELCVKLVHDARVGIVYFYRLCFDLGTIPYLVQGITDEEVHWYGTNPLPSDVLPNLRWLIPLCADPDIAFPIEMHDKSNPAVNGATMKAKAMCENAAEVTG